MDRASCHNLVARKVFKPFNMMSAADGSFIAAWLPGKSPRMRKPSASDVCTCDESLDMTRFGIFFGMVFEIPQFR
jgi:hypothetical protein